MLRRIMNTVSSWLPSDPEARSEIREILGQIAVILVCVVAIKAGDMRERAIQNKLDEHRV